MKKLLRIFKCGKSGETLEQDGEYVFRAEVKKVGDREVAPSMLCGGTIVLESAMTEKKDEATVETTENENGKEEVTSNTTSSVQGSNMAGLSERVPVEFSFLEKFNTIALRILLIDDKIGKKDNNRFRDLIESNQPITVEIKDCNNNQCTNCPKLENNENCKLHVIKKLMNYPNSDDIKDQHNYFHYWNQVGIKTYYCPTVIKDFIGDPCLKAIEDANAINVYSASEGKKGQKDGTLNIKCDFAPKIEKENLHVQIVGVRDVRTALLLMSKFKFDMVFCDYLLDYKEGDSGPRDYATQLFEFLSHNYKKDIQKEKEQKPQDEAKIKRLEVLDQLRHDVLDNRGPLDKLWIMPITGFNQTFIQDLYRNQINLIGHKWNISNGADPITTPWQFLYHLNKFIELQLKSCVYTRDKLMTFLQYSGDDLINRIKGKVDGLCFEEFQQFMGAEYSNFMKRYGARKLIERDAVTDGDNSNKSLFAAYIARNFYNDSKYTIETELNRMMQGFYHWAATMFNDRYGHQRLRIAFEHMRVFIAYNKLEEDAEDSHKLLYSLRFLHAVIDSEFDCKKISDWLKYNNNMKEVHV